MTIRFSEFTVDESIDPFCVLRRSKPIPLRSQARHVLDAAFDSGGYVAGGFARLMAQCALTEKSVAVATVSGGHNRLMADGDRIDYIVESAIHHLRLYQLISDIDAYESKVVGSGQTLPQWRNVGKGDIDLFFPDKEAVRKFIDLIRPLEGQDGFTVRKSKMNVALELGCDDHVRIQAITTFTGEMHDRLRSFDIFNAMVAYTPGKFTIPEGWFELEKTNTLHVVNWTNGYVINRINKYFNNFGYSNLTSATAHEVAENSMKYITEVRALAVEDKNALVKADRVKHYLTRYLPSMSNEDLLLLTSIIPNTSYNKLTPFSELRKRSEKLTK